MAVKIGHASIDENGKATGGKAGDQTGKEVKISSWYSGGWGFVARAKEASVAEAIAASAEAGCNNPNIGYDQSGRNTLMTQAKAASFDLSKIATPCEADCSSFVSVCVRAALGRDFYSGNAPTTSTLKNVLKGTGAFDILTDSKYLTDDKYLCRGDMLCKPGSHAVIVLSNGSAAETKVTESGTESTSAATYNVALPLLQKGSEGDCVKALQILLIGWGYSCGKWGADGEFGSGTENAVECFQEDNGLTVDGEVGPKTWAALLT